MVRRALSKAISGGNLHRTGKVVIIRMIKTISDPGRWDKVMQSIWSAIQDATPHGFSAHAMLVITFLRYLADHKLTVGRLRHLQLPGMSGTRSSSERWGFALVAVEDAVDAANGIADDQRAHPYKMALTAYGTDAAGSGRNTLVDAVVMINIDGGVIGHVEDVLCVKIEREDTGSGVIDMHCQVATKTQYAHGARASYCSIYGCFLASEDDEISRRAATLMREARVEEIYRHPTGAPLGWLRIGLEHSRTEKYVAFSNSFILVAFKNAVIACDAGPMADQLREHYTGTAYSISSRSVKESLSRMGHLSL